MNEYDPVPKASYGAIMDFKEMLVKAAALSRDSSLSKYEKLEVLHNYQATLRAQNKHPRLLNPGQIYLIYKTSRMDPSITKKAYFNGNPLLDDIKPHYVIENTISEHFDTFDVRYDMMVRYLYINRSFFTLIIVMIIL